MSEMEALTIQRDEARADRDLYKRVIDAIAEYLKTGTIDELAQAKSTTFHAVVETRVALGISQTKIAELSGQVADFNIANARLADHVVELEHLLAIEKGRPGHDSYRDDLLKVVCAMVSSFEPNAPFDPATVAFGAGVLLDKVYAEAAKRR
jgi:hypothetical protein